MSGQTDQSLPCIVCGIRSPADGSVCAECSKVLKSAVTGTVSPHSVAGDVNALSESPTSPNLLPRSSGSFPRAEEVGRRYNAGDVLNERYTIVEEIGTGGMGIVYKALDRNLEKTVALKLMRPRAMDPANVARFRRELALAQHVSHSNVCRVHDLGEVDGVLYISMEHVEGQRLDHLIVSMGRLSPRQTVALGRQLCAGLRAIHEQGIIHRDLKPSNIMVNRSGHVFIMDFGLAIRPGRDKVTSTGAVLGTFAYLSPEQARGLEISPRSDVYAAGLILYEMLTGVMPPGDDVALPLALRDARERCPPPSELAADVPPELDDFVMRCLERDPGKRFESAAQLEGTLNGLYEGWGVASSQPQERRSLSQRIFSHRTTRRWWPAALAAVVLAAASLPLAQRGCATSAAAPIVAVLPLANESGDPSIDYVGAGLADVLSTRLAALPGLTIVSSSSTRKYLRTAVDAARISQDLGVTRIICGGVHRSGDRLRITLNLLRPDATIERGQQFEARLDEIFALQSELAAWATAQLDLAVDAKAKRKLTAPAASNREAFILYSSALVHLENADKIESIDGAIDLLKQALQHDPRFALAHATLGEAYWSRYTRTKDTSWTKAASEAVLEALRLDPDQPAVRLSLARIYGGTGRPSEAVEELRKTLAVQPGSDDAQRLLGDVLADLNRSGEAIQAYQKAVELRPGYWRNHSRLGAHYFELGQFAEAERAFQETARLRPDSPWGRQMLGSVYQVLGRQKEALDAYEAALSVGPEPTVYGNMGAIHLDRGDYAAAARSYDKMVELAPRNPAGHRGRGDVLAKLGDSTGARDAYTRALELHLQILQVNSKDALTLSRMAIVEAKLQRATDADAHIAAALALSPNKDVLYRKAVVLTHTGRLAEALDVLRAAIAKGYPAEAVRHDADLASLRPLTGFKTALTLASEKQPTKEEK